MKKAFSITDPLWEESVGDRWFPPQRTSNVDRWCFFIVSLNNLLNKRSGWRWCETSLHSCIMHNINCRGMPRHIRRYCQPFWIIVSDRRKRVRNRKHSPPPPPPPPPTPPHPPTNKEKQTNKRNHKIMFDHDGVIKWKHFPRYWPFVQGIHRWSDNSPHKASDVELWCFLWSVPKCPVKQTIMSLVIWDVIVPIMTPL